MIEKYAFVNLPKLKYLSLSNNPYLIHVGGKSFGHTIPGIQVLKLSNNAIDLLPGAGFDWLVSIYSLIGRANSATTFKLYRGTKRRESKNTIIFAIQEITFL